MTEVAEFLIISLVGRRKVWTDP